MLTYKYKKESDTELAHTDVFWMYNYIGYYIKNNSTLASKEENWNFVSKIEGIPHFYSNTKQDLKDSLISYFME